MKRNGQVLILFVVLIPAILLLATFVIDMGNVLYQSNKIDHINRLVIRYGLENEHKLNIKSKMVDLIYENDNNIDEYTLSIDEGIINLEIKKTANSIFGRILGTKWYHIDSKYRGHINDNNDYIIEKVK